MRLFYAFFLESEGNLRTALSDFPFDFAQGTFGG